MLRYVRPMNATPSNCQGKRVVAVIAGLVALLSSSSPLPAAGENVILQTQKPRQALEKAQGSKHESIENLEKKFLREAAREVSRNAAQEAARNAVRHFGQESARHGARPEGHHHGPGGY